MNTIDTNVLVYFVDEHEPAKQAMTIPLGRGGELAGRWWAGRLMAEKWSAVSWFGRIGILSEQREKIYVDVDVFHV